MEKHSLELILQRISQLLLSQLFIFQFYGESMKKVFSKIFVGIGITIVSSPVLLLALFVVIEVVGSIANHAATNKQTNELTAYIEKSIEDASIIDTYSFTGNTSGTGNHVECESKVTFNSNMAKDEVNRIFDAKYEYRELEKKDGSYVITVYGDAPFPDNIEGH